MGRRESMREVVDFIKGVTFLFCGLVAIVVFAITVARTGIWIAFKIL